MQTISIFEHESLTVGEKGLTETHLLALERFLGNNNEESFPYYSLIYKGVKFRQYVGVLCVGDLTIEVLPKTDKDSNKKYWRDKLIFMLSKVYKLDVKMLNDAPQTNHSNSTILDVFIKRYLDEVDKLLNRGLVKCYHKEVGNRKALKGKLLTEEHLRKNIVHKERFYVRYNTYDYQHIMNQILRQAMEIVPMATSDVILRGRAYSTLFSFPELDDIPVAAETFDNLLYDRKTEDYRMAIRLARLLLLHYMPKKAGNGDDVLALMFDMNKLWEEFVCVSLRKKLKNHNVHGQESKYFWESKDYRHKTIKPDIVISNKNGKAIAILDTKWKIPSDGPSDSDLHQMFVYMKMFETSRVALVYPSHGKSRLIRANFKDLTNSDCSMLFLNIDDLQA